MKKGGINITDFFPNFIKKLPKAEIPIDGCTAYLFQGQNQQIILMEFEELTIVPEHSHESQWEIVLDGSVDVWIENNKHHYQRGDRFYIESNVKHRAKVYPGYKAIACFNQPDRYKEITP